MKKHLAATSSLLTLIRHASSASSLRSLLEKFNCPDLALQAGIKEWRSAGLTDKACAHLLSPDLVRLEQDLEWCDEPDHHVIAWHDADYPELLRQTENPPAALFVVGNIDLLWHPQIAIVGSRHPTPGGRENAKHFARTFAESGWCVTSGLAEGIDTSAHGGALSVPDNSGRATVAVVATGLDVMYPAQNRGLAEIIARHGAIISEHPPGTPPLKEHFPSRNRIIAGLSLGCLVVEAAERSGALITARLAAEIGRELFAIPGSIHNPMTRGCHKLIRQGAILVEKPADLTDALRPVADQLARALRGRLEEIDSGHRQTSSPRQLTLLHKPIWEALGHDFVCLDQLAERTGLTTPELSSMLLVMELEGNITVTDGRYARNT